MNTVTRFKRGQKFVVIETGDEVTLNRIKENGEYFCDYPNGSFESFGPNELKPVLKQRTEVNKISSTKKENDKTYSILRKVFLTNHKICEAQLPGCTVKATEVHHKKGRVGKNYLDVHAFLALCNNCHRHIETHPEWAKENGYSLDRL